MREVLVGDESLLLHLAAGGKVGQCQESFKLLQVGGIHLPERDRER
jgi:hypothetical protein